MVALPLKTRLLEPHKAPKNKRPGLSSSSFCLVLKRKTVEQLDFCFFLQLPKEAMKQICHDITGVSLSIASKMVRSWWRPGFLTSPGRIVSKFGSAEVLNWTTQNQYPKPRTVNALNLGICICTNEQNTFDKYTNESTHTQMKYANERNK